MKTHLLSKRIANGSWAIFFAMAIAVCWAPTGQQFPAAVLSAFVIPAVFYWLPRCRIVVKTPLCPWNWALFVFAIQLVGMPLLITLDGPSARILPHLPSSFAINMAMVVNCIAFVTVCVVYSYFAKSRIRAAALDESQNTPAVREGGAELILIFAALGLTGVLLSFGNFAGVLDYFNDPGYYRDLLLDASSTWRGLGALLLKPFLGFAIVMAWCTWIDSGVRDSSWWKRVPVMVSMVAGVILSFSLFGYNRGAFVVPLVAVAAVMFVKGDKFSRRMIIVVGMLVLALMPLYAVYRGSSELGEDLLSQEDLQDSLREQIDISDIVQMYGGAPQYLGYLLEQSNWGSELHWGGVTVSSILSPVPVIGKAFRQSSGFAIYNRLIYGGDAIADQNAPFVAEAFLDFHILGILFGYTMFGWVLHCLQQAFERSRSSLELYIWQYLAIWICFVIFGSIEVPSQLLIYFCCPIYLFWLTTRMPGCAGKRPALLAQHPIHS